MTLSVDAEQFQLASIDQIWHRLIPSRFPPIRVYERIAANDQHDAVTELEVLTSPRVRARQRLIGIGAVDEASPQLQNWNHAPFTYLNPEGSALFRPAIAVLELFDTLQTALAVSVVRRERFLRSTRVPKLGLDMRVLTTRIRGEFADLRGAALPDNKSERWTIGDRLVKAQVDGVLFNCPERSGASCLAVLNSGVLERSVQADHFRFVWDGARILSLYSFSGQGTVIAADALSGPAIKELQ
ncbi:RES family NAD+ phosphorylase [Sphingomonas sp. J315]|uniref:RES family NAD+ phosphorylase n=1 Tax=Sphingomonas sp. J315 TaxID=2898433 RepID=UPI0021AE1281|nr:RES family NAD+ phosphorylase [Sphingomonas sp. J315]UUY01306.1 RES family NAD+ phosphorylase [Sphingomonas sp. J315]